VVADFNTLLRELSPSGKVVVVSIAETSDEWHAGGCSNHVVIGAYTVSFNASGMRFGQALKILARVCALSCSLTEHGAVLARDNSHDWETQRDPAIDNEEVLAVAEAVFRYQCEHLPESMGRGDERTRCVRLFEKDPTQAFLARFKGISPPVTRGSGFREGTDLLLEFRGCRRVNLSTIQVSGECFSDGLSFARSMFTVVKRDRAWVVVEAVVTLIG
jgi:hypothetical protein